MSESSTFPTLGPSSAYEVIADDIRAGLVPMLHGSPSTAKSAIMKQLANDFNLELIDLRLSQLEPTDLLGFPHIDKELNPPRAVYVPFAHFPLEGDPIPKGKDGWLLFLDEFNAGSNKGTEKAAYRLSLDREVGQYKLHPRCAVAMAGNLITDMAFVEEMSSAQKTRIVSREMKANHGDFLTFARANDFDFRITSYLDWQPNHTYTFNPETVEGEYSYACYRTWEFTNKLLKVRPDLDKLSTAKARLAGILGEGVARSFLAYLACFGDLPQFADIEANPTTALMPTDAGPLFALASSLALHATDDNVENLIKYVERMPVEMQVCCFQEMVRHNHKFLHHSALQPWKQEFFDNYM